MEGMNLKLIGKTLDSYGENIQTTQRILTGMVIEQELFQKGTGSRGQNKSPAGQIAGQ